MKIQRHIYPTQAQKRKLIRLIAQHPQLVSCKVTPEFNYKDSQRLWQFITNQCNALPGPKKTWEQWRRTFQDMRTKSKRKQREMNGEIPYSAKAFTPLEQEVLGYKLEIGGQETSTDSADHGPNTLEQEQVMVETNYTEDLNLDNNELQSDEPNSPPETKVFQKHRTVQRTKNKQRPYIKSHPNSCLLNCDLLASQEQEKIRIKEDYLNFKKDYLRQKLKIMKEQTEALKSIARELAK